MHYILIYFSQFCEKCNICVYLFVVRSVHILVRLWYCIFYLYFSATDQLLFKKWVYLKGDKSPIHLLAILSSVLENSDGYLLVSLQIRQCLFFNFVHLQYCLLWCVLLLNINIRTSLLILEIIRWDCKLDYIEFIK